MTHANRICVLLLVAARLTLAAEAEPELLRLARARFKTLSANEEKMFREVAAGLQAVCTGDPPIRAECIEWLCTDNAATGLVSHGGVHVVGARIDGELRLQHAQIPFPLTFEKCSFNGTIVLKQTEVPALSLQGTHTKGILADWLKVGGAVMLGTGFRADGTVSLAGATIGGDLDCSGGQFVKKCGSTLNASGLKVDGNLYLRQLFRAEGTVNVIGATVGRDLDCSGGHFLKEDGDALLADGLEVKGSVYLRRGFLAEGKVSFMSAKVERYFQWHGVDSPEKATLDLRSARVGTLWDKKDNWPGKLFLQGFVYDGLHDEPLLRAEERKRWLQLQPKGQFHPQPYEQLAKVLRQQGREEDAKQILIAKNEERVRLAEMSRCSRLWHRFLGWSLAYGYQPWRPLWGALVFMVLGAVLFGWRHRQGPMQGKKDGGLDQSFNCIVYSIDLFLPGVNFHQAEAEWPKASGWTDVSDAPDTRRNRWGWWLRAYAWAHITAGWIITALFLAGLSGLVRG
jgi:hypothetical protein